MATLVLSTVGTLIGGPIGGAVGALLGHQIDGQLLAPRQQGPRLKDLKVSGSSYGDAIPRHFGRVRTSGTIIWATDLKEHAEKSGGGKGKPKSTTYSYSISFAVALACAPIDGIGRIWADGNLLRGAAGDLKTQGRMRIYRGSATQQPDPLMAAAIGPSCPAYRGCSYVVFEDLALGDFGNRIPALSFEVTAGSGEQAVAALARAANASGGAECRGLIGFSHEGGSIAQTLDLIGTVYPFVPILSEDTLRIDPSEPETDPVELDRPAAWDEGEFGKTAGASRACSTALPGRGLGALRYYDAGRDFQPGLQRALGGGDGETLEFPGVLAAATARGLVESARCRAAMRRDSLSWRTATLDPRVRPGTIVKAPGVAGLWRVASWELRTGGVEMTLERHFTASRQLAPADPGESWSPQDRLPQPSQFEAFELPWDGVGSAFGRQAFVAASAAPGLWNGGVLYARRGDALEAIADVPARRAVIGDLVAPLGPSDALRIEPASTLLVRLLDPSQSLETSSPEGLARGANRVRVGHEILQFVHARPLGDGVWEVSGLLRGRGGTEGHALATHGIGERFILLDDRLLAVPEDVPLAPRQPLALIGIADDVPAEAVLQARGTTLRPLAPVHPRCTVEPGGQRRISWVRRGRGAWDWPDEVEIPLVEEIERYQIGLGPVRAPFASWVADTPEFTMGAAKWAELAGAYPGETLWVRQFGRGAKSDPLKLCALS